MNYFIFLFYSFLILYILYHIFNNRKTDYFYINKNNRKIRLFNRFFESQISEKITDFYLITDSIVKPKKFQKIFTKPIYKSTDL